MPEAASTRAAAWQPDEAAIAALVEGRHGDPFAILGMHSAPGAPLTVRVFWPGADSVAVLDAKTGKRVAELEKLHADGFFAGPIPGRRNPFPYRLRFSTGDVTWEADDPYRFPPVLGEMDVYLIAEGSHRRIFERLGAHPREIEGVDGFFFALWAPNARRVSVVGDFNMWDGRRHPMRKRVEAGIWELFIPGVAARHDLQIRAGRRQRPAAAAEGGSRRLRAGASARHRLARRRPAALRMGRRRLDGRPPRAPGARRADVDLRGASRLVAPRRRRPLSQLRRARRPARALREGHGLHPYRVPAGQRAPLLGLLGLSADRALRADQPLRLARRFRPLRRPLPPGGARRHHRLGAGAFSHRRARPRSASTAPRFTSTRTRASASIATGTR